MAHSHCFRVAGSFLIACACLGFIRCQNDPYKPVIGLPRDLTPAESQLITSDNAFGFKLFRAINDAEAEKNVFISPLSVSMALGMTYNGAAGETEAAMRDVLELGGMSLTAINESYQSLIKLLTGLDPKVVFQIANSIWYKQELPFEKDFLDINSKYFDAEVAGLDFSDLKSVDTINDWVDDKTRGKIERILDEINPLAVMFLINAIYFKGTWTYEFDKNETKNDQFTLMDGSTVPCRMMKQEGDFLYYATEDFQAIDLPYGEEEFSMTVILPRPGST
jgi:serine protease inhibitor